MSTHVSTTMPNTRSRAERIPRRRLLVMSALLVALLGFATAIEYGVGTAVSHDQGVLASDGTAIGHNLANTNGDGTAVGMGRY